MEKVVRILNSCSLLPASGESVLNARSVPQGMDKERGRGVTAKPNPQTVNERMLCCVCPLPAQWLTLPPIVSPIYRLLHLSLRTEIYFPQ